MQLNASRIEVLQAQDDLVKSMMESARKELLYLSQDHQSYKKLLRILIVQVSRWICIFLANVNMKHEFVAATAINSSFEPACINTWVVAVGDSTNTAQVPS
jgi:hypothetical protein